jgi:hypothetical protein
VTRSLGRGRGFKNIASPQVTARGPFRVDGSKKNIHARLLMRKFPHLTVVDPASTSKEPPSILDDPGRALWTQVMAEYDVSDVAGRSMLMQCCQMIDRAEGLAAEIETDGAVIRTREGLKDHPCLKHELAARAFVVRTLCRLGLNFEPLRVNMGRPPGR